MDIGDTLVTEVADRTRHEQHNGEDPWEAKKQCYNDAADHNSPRSNVLDAAAHHTHGGKTYKAQRHGLYISEKVGLYVFDIEVVDDEGEQTHHDGGGQYPEQQREQAERYAPALHGYQHH